MDVQIVAQGNAQHATKSVWTAAQKRIAALLAFAVLIDGFDVQLISLSLPAIARDLKLERAAFAGVLAMGTIGTAIGAFMGGYFLDRVGRKLCLALSLVLVGLASAAMSGCSNITEFTVVRLFVGIGIGGAMTSATTCFAEFTPPHRRSAVIAFGVLCVPLGGLWASVTSAMVLEPLGWKTLFLIGGLLSLAMAAIVFVRLPESPGFLANQPHRQAELDAVLTKLEAHDWAVANTTTSTTERKAGLLELLSREWRWDTICLWIALFFSLMSAFLTINWLPSLLVREGASLTQSSSANAATGIGAILGSLSCVLTLQQLGTKRPLWTLGIGGVMISLWLAWAFYSKQALPLIFILLAASQFSGAFLQALLYTLLAQVYPSVMRGTGVGTGMAIGRLGAIASAFAGGWAMEQGGATFYIFQGLTLAITVIFALSVKRHVAGISAKISG